MAYITDQKDKNLPFKEAKEFIHSLNFKNTKEWEIYIESGNKPNNIPKYPRLFYKYKGWISWGDWLGNDYMHYTQCNYLTYLKAKKILKNLKIQGKKEWFEYCKSGNKPINIPTNPPQTYKNKGWISWGDWLGNNKIASKNISFLSFDETKKYLAPLKIQGSSGWEKYIKSGKKPSNIYSSPYKFHYEWKGWNDFLGCNIEPSFIINKEYLSYDEVKKYVKILNIKNCQEWNNYYLNNKLPSYIPKTPQFIYKNKGWNGWPDFLGSWETTAWHNSVIISFIKSLKENICHLDYADLLILCQSNGLQDTLLNNSKLNNIFSTPANSEARKLAVQALLDLENETINSDTETIDEPLTAEQISNNLELPTLNTDVINAIESLDDIQTLGINTDADSLEYFKVKYVNALWYACINSKNHDIFVKSLNTTNKPLSDEIKILFKDEYDQVNSIKIPKSYDYRKKGNLVVPNLMQKLTAFRVKNNQYFGNWSDTGTGKTISALLSSGYIEAKTIIIIANNSTVNEWKEVIKNTYKNVEVILNPINDTFLSNRNNLKPLYVIINYDKFSNTPFKTNGKGIGNILLKLNPDFVIFDEIQMIKQRADKSSNRRYSIAQLLKEYRNANVNLKVLGMSATPIMNELMEPVKLLEMLTGNDYSDLDTTATIPNAIKIHMLMMTNGIRFKMDHKSKLFQQRSNIERQDLLNEFKESSGSVIDIERTCLKAKLNNIQDYIQGKTMIYLHYVENRQSEALMIDMVRYRLDQLDLSYSVYTGSEKDDLKDFTEGDKQVLICSRPVNTGVDGLQDVCSNMVVLSLPWTYAEYKQLIGRIQRQGQTNNKVNIHIPRVYLNVDDKEWSWDDERWNLIMTKKTLSDLVMDGEVPSGRIPSKQVLLSEASKKLDEWIKKVQEDDIDSSKRNIINLGSIKYTEELKSNKTGNKINLSDFSIMNRNWNQKNSSTVNKELNKDSKEWFKYHKAYTEKRKIWKEIPYKVVANKIKLRKDWIIGDFGCGENLLSTELKNKIYAFDHVAINKNVIACDMKKVPLEDETLDVAIFSLSLMSRNWIDYIQEAYRVLKPMGHLYICEPETKWFEKELEFKDMIESVGFRCFNIERSNNFIYLEGFKQ